jgi:hypothetical protein
VLSAATGAVTRGAVPLHRLYGDFNGDFLLGSVGPKGLTSNSNYILNSVVGASTNPVVGLSVTIDITEAIVLKSSSGSIKGFSFQLNAYSMDGYTCGYQQYVIAMDDTALYGIVNNYAVQGNPARILRWTPALVDLGGTTLAAGHKLIISLHTDDSGKVTGVTFTVRNAQGQEVGSATELLTDIPGIAALGTAPIAGFVMNFVGPAGGEQSILEPGGSGTFTYASNAVLRASNQSPKGAESLNFFTVETANTVYGYMSASASQQLVQTFNTNGTTESVGVTRGLRRPVPPRRGV